MPPPHTHTHRTLAAYSSCFPFLCVCVCVCVFWFTQSSRHTPRDCAHIMVTTDTTGVCSRVLISNSFKCDSSLFQALSQRGHPSTHMALPSTWGSPASACLGCIALVVLVARFARHTPLHNTDSVTKPFAHATLDLGYISLFVGWCTNARRPQALVLRDADAPHPSPSVADVYVRTQLCLGFRVGCYEVRNHCASCIPSEKALIQPRSLQSAAEWRWRELAI